MRYWDGQLFRSDCGKAKTFADVFDLKVGILVKNLEFRDATRQEAEDRCNWYPQTPDAGQAIHLICIHGDARKVVHRPISIFALSDDVVDYVAGYVSEAELAPAVRVG